MILISASFSVWWVILPLFIVQYALAIFSLTRLAFCNISLKQYIIWNLVCLLVFFVGSIVFLTYFYTHKAKLVSKQTHKQDKLIIDVPIDKIETDIDVSDKANINIDNSDSDKKN